MAVAIASGLGKDVAGDPLLRDVSFKVERGERLTLSGRNGSGKTTLLRMLAGETRIDAGELSLEKGARVALHDQRPPRERDLSLREYVLSGCADLVDARGAARAAGAGDGVGRPRTRRRSTTTRPRRLGSSTPAATTGAAGRRRWCADSASRDDDLDRPLRTFSGGELTRGVARAHARRRSGPAAARRAHQPPRRRLARVARGAAHRASDAAIVLVAHDRWFLEAVGTAVLELEAGRSRFFAGPWHAWRKEKAARELALRAGRSSASRRRSSAWSGS